MAEAFERIYTDEQRDALAYAYEDRRIRPARRVVELAAAGRLEFNGEQLAPFTTNENTVRDEARKLRRRRAGQETSELAHMPPRDAIEALRRRLVNGADALMREFERTVKRDPAKADPERLRQIARAVREAQAIPGPDEPRKPAPGQRHDGQRAGGETRGGMAGAILAAHRRAPSSPSPDEQTAPPTSRLNTRTHTPSTTPTENTQPQRLNAPRDSEPGSLVRERAAALGLEL